MVDPAVSCAIADRALAALEAEARRWPDCETGGILVGRRHGGVSTVTHATGPGPNAIHSPVAFAKDTVYLQRVLDYLFQCFGVNYLGVWHQHPPEMPYPSAGDLRSAWQDIADPEVPGQDLLIPICTQRGGSVKVVPYLAQRTGYTRVEWQVVPYAGLLSGQWYESPRGKERLAQEVAALKDTGSRVEVRRTEDGNYNVYASLSPRQSGTADPDRYLVFGCPQDFPVSPPQVALHDAGAGQFSPVALPGLDAWGLDSTLAGLYGEWKT
ncbi:MAG: Mov34/MPN/PAD-1 family protein [Chloroflexi bacterium]|nr:Mov34/MPN/PAD-1 family protein [Chloroflexota bacterium]